jgi:hypothetical protein
MLTPAEHKRLGTKIIRFVKFFLAISMRQERLAGTSKCLEPIRSDGIAGTET